MTRVYFVRHAEPNYENHDDLTRELTAKGWADRKKVTAFLWDKAIDLAFSSPYKRSIDTIGDFIKAYGLTVETDYDFRERKVGDGWLDDFDSFAKKQWADFGYKLEHGETLAEVQQRNIAALHKVLERSEDKNVVIATHGTALSTIINYYDDSFGYEDFYRIQDVMPWLVEMQFEGSNFIRWKEHELPEASVTTTR